MQIKNDEWKELSITYSHIDAVTGELVKSVWGTSDPKVLEHLRSSLHLVDIRMAWSLSPSNLNQIKIRTSRHNYIAHVHQIGKNSFTLIFYYNIKGVVRALITPEFKVTLVSTIQSSTGHRPVFDISKETEKRSRQNTINLSQTIHKSYIKRDLRAFAQNKASSDAGVVHATTKQKAEDGQYLADRGGNQVSGRPLHQRQPGAARL
ncbi:MAG: hypothetical protein JJU36_04525 [Phycisphaeraceae bacterium]|nr:hypothetical protein [Phycisphaeraceae bacterium]